MGPTSKPVHPSLFSCVKFFKQNVYNRIINADGVGASYGQTGPSKMFLIVSQTFFFETVFFNVPFSVANGMVFI